LLCPGLQLRHTLPLFSLGVGGSILINNREEQPGKDQAGNDTQHQPAEQVPVVSFDFVLGLNPYFLSLIYHLFLGQGVNPLD